MRSFSSRIAGLKDWSYLAVPTLAVIAVIVISFGSDVGAAGASQAAHPIGSTQSLVTNTGVPYSVRLTAVLDPATATTPTFMGPKTGTRFVAAEFTIANNGNTTLTGDANGDASVVATNDQVYTWTFSTVTQCTNFASGAFDLGQGNSETGCVVFDIPDGATVKRVIWAGTSGFGKSVEWTVSTATPTPTPSPTPPGAPAKPTATAGKEMATVSWAKDTTTHGAPIASYTVTSSTGHHTCSPTTLSSLSCAVIGLMGGRTYSFTVRAHNAQGTSPASPPSNPVTLSAAKPAKPAIPRVTGRSGEVTVRWAAPTTGGAHITRYVVTSTTRHHSCEWTKGPLSCKVTDLVSRRAYRFRVVAYNSVGSSAPSSYSGFVRPSKFSAAPKVTSVSPREGPSSGSTVVTITGVNFVRGAIVRFGTRGATNVTVVNSGRITARSPAGAAGWVRVSVTTVAGTSAPSVADLFRYTTTAACPAIPYNHLIRDPTSMKGVCVSYRAKVFQYTSRTGLALMLIEVTPTSGLVAVTIKPTSLAKDVYQTDSVEVTGRIEGSYTYTTTTGGTNTVPEINATRITVVSTATG